MTTKTKAPKKATPPPVDDPVVVTTQKGVFFGYLPKDADHAAPIIRLERARMAVRWWDTKGVAGLAVTGPNTSCRIGPQVPSVTIQAVTAVFVATPAAATAWESAPWNR